MKDKAIPETRVVKLGNAPAKQETAGPARFYARDNEGNIHWGPTPEAAALAATQANIDLRENH